MTTLRPIIVRSQRDLDVFWRGLVYDFEHIRMDPFLRREQRELEKLHAEYFRRQMGPDYERWPENAPETIRRKGHRRILRGLPSQGFELEQSLTQQLATHAIRREVDEWPGLAEIVFGTDRPFAELHQEGRPPRLPRRSHTGLTRPHIDGMQTRFADFIVSKLGGR